MADALGSGEPRGQVRGINLLWAALVLVVGGSMVGSLIGIRQLAGKLWFWFGNQGWEYLDLASGRTRGAGHRCMAEHAASPFGSLWDERHEGAR